MRAPAHVAVGYVTTGLVLSFSDINILSRVEYLIVIFAASLLPDIDHPKSLFGKIFPPIAQYLSRAFGHRTITHSILAIVVVFTFCRVSQSLFFPDFPLTSLVSVAYSSHVILDMITVQGVPLFYPFMKNSCVMPGNAAYRLSTNNLSHEMIVLASCVLLSALMSDLFANGFWTTYNQSFSNMKHLVHEFRRSEDLLNIRFVDRSYSVLTEHEGLLIYVDSKELVTVEDSKMITYDLKETIIETLEFDHSSLKAQLKDYYLSNISEEDFQDYLNEVIVNITLMSPSSFIGLLDGTPFDEKILQLDYPNSLRFVQFPDENRIDLTVLEIDCI